MSKKEEALLVITNGLLNKIIDLLQEIEYLERTKK